MTELLTAKEVCEILRIKLATLRGWTSEEKIPVVRFGQKHGKVRYRKTDIEEFIKSSVQPINPIHTKGRQALTGGLRGRR